MIASAGEELYRLEKSDLDELARQYELGARGWAFDHWSERLQGPGGEKAFDSWSGGAVGEMIAQAKDRNEALEKWLGKAATLQSTH